MMLELVNGMSANVPDRSYSTTGPGERRLEGALWRRRIPKVTSGSWAFSNQRLFDVAA